MSHIGAWGIWECRVGGGTTYILTHRTCFGHRDLEVDEVYLQASSSLITWFRVMAEGLNALWLVQVIEHQTINICGIVEIKIQLKIDVACWRTWLVSFTLLLLLPEGTLSSLHWAGWIERRADLRVVLAKKNINVPVEIGTVCRPAAILWW